MGTEMTELNNHSCLRFHEILSDILNDIIWKIKVQLKPPKYGTKHEYM